MSLSIVPAHKALSAYIVNIKWTISIELFGSSVQEWETLLQPCYNNT